MEKDEEKEEEEEFKGISVKQFIKEYDMSERLGEGINSNVFKIKKKKNLCVKCFKGVNSYKNMMHEIEIIDMLDHSGIPKVYKSATVVDNVEKKYYMVMDLIDGKTLEKFIEKKPKIGTTILKDITKRLLEITSHIHSRGVVHRDIKPNNILIDDKNKLYLVDFNLAKYVEEDPDNPKTTKFKIGYMSPKCSYLYAAPELHVLDSKFNESTDLYSIGVVLYILVFGLENYQACKKGKDCATAKSHHNLISNIKAADKISKKLKQVLYSLLSFDPEDRPTCEEALKMDWFS